MQKIVVCIKRICFCNGYVMHLNTVEATYGRVGSCVAAAHSVLQKKNKILFTKSPLQFLIPPDIKGGFISEHRLPIHIKVRCLFVYLFGFGAQTAGWISAKFSMDHPLDPMDNLEKIFLGVTPQEGYGYKLSPYGPELLGHFWVPFAQL